MGTHPGYFSTHSVFANVLLENLSTMQTSEFTGEQLWIHVFGDVQQRGASQKPEYHQIPRMISRTTRWETLSFESGGECTRSDRECSYCVGAGCASEYG